MIRRIVGVIFLIIAVVGWVFVYQGIRLTNQFVDNLAVSLDNALGIATDTLDNMESTLIVANQSVTDLSATLSTMEAASGDISQSLEQSEPLIDGISQVVTMDVPESLEAVQDTIPSLIEVAGVVDRALETLSRFEIDQTIPIINYRIQYDLGVDYDPDVPFDQAVSELGASLEGMPESLRELDTQLETTRESLNTMTGDLDQLGSDMAQLNETIQEFEPVLAEYLRITRDINDRLRIAQGQVTDQANQVKQIFTGIFIWMGLLQLVPLYLGLEMVAGERGIEQYVTEEEYAERMTALKRELGLDVEEEVVEVAEEPDEPGSDIDSDDLEEG